MVYLSGSPVYTTLDLTNVEHLVTTTPYPHSLSVYTKYLQMRSALNTIYQQLLPILR